MLAAAEVLTDYDTWLERQALALRTRTAYRRWVRDLVEQLEEGRSSPTSSPLAASTIVVRS